MLPVQSYNSSYLTNSILSGYNQINQVKYLTALSNKSSVSAVSGVQLGSSSTLDKSSSQFLKEYQERMSQLAAAADKVLNAKPDKLAASSEDRAVAQASGRLANAGDSYELTVTQTAAGQVNRSNGFASEGELPAIGGSLDIKTSRGNFHISLSSAGARTNQEALEKFAQKINASGAGVTATVTQKDGKSYLALEGETGADSSFSVSGSAARSLGLDQIESAGRDAVFTLSKNNGEDSGTYTSATNSVEVDGISIRFNGAGKTTIRAGADDTAGALDAMRSLVDQYNSAIRFLEKNEDRGIGVLQQLKRMVSPPASAGTMQMIGLSSNSDGTLKLDEDAFTEAMDKNPTFMKEIAKGIADNAKQDAQAGMNAPSASLVGNAGKGNAFYNKIDSLLGGDRSAFNLMSTYSRTGVYNLSNYYAVGAMMNLFI